MEALPNRAFVKSKIRERFLNVVELVCRRDQSNGRIRAAQMAEVRFLALKPRRLGNNIRIGTILHKLSDARSKFPANGPKPPDTALILHRVVQQGGNCFVLVATVGENNRGHTKQMGDVGARGSFAELGGVSARCINQRSLKALTEWRRDWHQSVQGSGAANFLDVSAVATSIRNIRGSIPAAQL